jgi:hypothetical protein
LREESSTANRGEPKVRIKKTIEKNRSITGC